eukprot:scpid25879/ scgid23768/ 
MSEHRQLSCTFYHGMRVTEFWSRWRSIEPWRANLCSLNCLGLQRLQVSHLSHPAVTELSAPAQWLNGSQTWLACNKKSNLQLFSGQLNTEEYHQQPSCGGIITSSSCDSGNGLQCLRDQDVAY